MSPPTNPERSRIHTEIELKLEGVRTQIRADQTKIVQAKIDERKTQKDQGQIPPVLAKNPQPDPEPVLIQDINQILSVTPCPCCTKNIDIARYIKQTDDVPRAGSFSVCPECAEIIALTDEMTFKSLTADDVLFLAQDVNACAELEAQQQKVRTKTKPKK